MDGKLVVFCTFVCIVTVSSITISPSSYCTCYKEDQFYVCRGLNFGAQEVKMNTDEEVVCSGNLAFIDCEFNEIPTNAFKIMKSTSAFSANGCDITDIFKWNFKGGNGVSSLSLDVNNIQIIPSDVFEYMTNMSELSISSNKISTLEEGCFNGLERLEVLRLDENRIRFIPENAFASLKGLLSINLRANQIEYLPDKVFSANSKLLYIYLRSNQLKIIDPKAPLVLKKLIQGASVTSPRFLRLPSVEYLDIAENYLPYVSKTTFSGLTSLKQLYIDSMNITYIEQDSFDCTTKLEFLTLARNKLEAFDVTLMSHISLPPYGFIDLSDNILKHINYELLPEIQNLDSISLMGNPWPCSFLDEMNAFFMASSISTNLEDSACVNETTTTIEDDHVQSTNVLIWVFCALAAGFIVLLVLFIVIRRLRHHNST